MVNLVPDVAQCAKDQAGDPGVMAVLKGLDFRTRVIMNNVIGKLSEEVDPSWWSDPVKVAVACMWPTQVQNYLDGVDEAVEKMKARIARVAAAEAERARKQQEADDEEAAKARPTVARGRTTARTGRSSCRGRT